MLRHTVIGGRRAGLTTVVGIAAGCLVWARNRQPAAQPLEGTRRVVGTWSALRTGMLTNLLNPKVGVFYISLRCATGSAGGWTG